MSERSTVFLPGLILVGAVLDFLPMITAMYGRWRRFLQCSINLCKGTCNLAEESRSQKQQQKLSSAQSLPASETIPQLSVVEEMMDNVLFDCC